MLVCMVILVKHALDECCMKKLRRAFLGVYPKIIISCIYCLFLWRLKRNNFGLILEQGDFLVFQWLRIRLPVQGTQVRSLVREIGSCMPRATKPACHNYWARMPQLESPCAATTELMRSGACAPQLDSPCAATREKPMCHSKRSHVLQLRPDTAKNK